MYLDPRLTLPLPLIVHKQILFAMKPQNGEYF